MKLRRFVFFIHLRKNLIYLLCWWSVKWVHLPASEHEYAELFPDVWRNVRISELRFGINSVHLATLVVWYCSCKGLNFGCQFSDVSTLCIGSHVT